MKIFSDWYIRLQVHSLTLFESWLVILHGWILLNSTGDNSRKMHTGLKFLTPFRIHKHFSSIKLFQLPFKLQLSYGQLFKTLLSMLHPKPSGNDHIIMLQLYEYRLFSQPKDDYISNNPWLNIDNMEWFLHIVLFHSRSNSLYWQHFNDVTVRSALPGKTRP